MGLFRPSLSVLLGLAMLFGGMEAGVWIESVVASSSPTTIAMEGGSATAKERRMQRMERKNMKGEKRGRRMKKKRGQDAGGVCAELEQKVGDTARAHRACRTDNDCRLLVRGCSPYLTCGQPVNKAGLDAVKMAIGEFGKECREEKVLCATCQKRAVTCDEGFCRLDPPLLCSEEVRTCSDGSTVSRNVDFDCKFDPCPLPTPPSSEGGESSTEGQQATP